MCNVFVGPITCFTCVLYLSKTGAHTAYGANLNKVVKKDGQEGVTTPSTYKLYDVQSDEFRRIFGFDRMANNSYSNSDTYEDPTYLIFDIKIITERSPP